MGRTFRRRKHVRDDKQINHDAQENDNDVELSKFCVRNGCLTIKRLHPYSFHGCGRGLQTMRSLLPGDKVIQIPKHLLITTRTALSNTLIRSAVQNSALKPTPVVLVSAFLLLERSKGDQSQWYYYLRSVPSDYTTLICMHEGDVDVLDSELRQKYEAMLTRIKQGWSELQSIFSGLFRGSSRHVDYADFLWAWHVINTRSVYYTHPVAAAEGESELSALISSQGDRGDNEDNFALAPYLDLLNHTDTAQVKAGYNTETECYEIITYDKYNKYDQVFISYGSHDNRFLLIEYGFCIRGNVNNAVNFSTDELVSLCTDSVTVRGKLTAQLRTRSLDRGLLCDSDGLSWNLTEALRILSESSHTADNRSQQTLTVSEMTTHLLRNATQTRRQLINNITHRSRDNVQVKRTEGQVFILDMLHILYQDELALLELAHVT